jgi:hypothetical protein
METPKAAEIIRALADGRDPATGEQFPPSSPYQQADTVRALFMALEAMESGAKPRTPRVIDPSKPKAGGPWTPEEEQQLRDEFAAHKPIPELAATHGRTPGAITARLVKLGLIEDTATNRAGAANRPGLSASTGPSLRSPDGWRGAAPPAGAKTDEDCPF